MMANGEQTGFQYRHENTDEICVDHCMRSLTEPGGIARQVPRKGRSESGSPESREQQGRKASRLPQNPPADCRPAGIPPAENQHQATIAGPAGVCYDPPHSGYSAAWLARLTGGQEVVGSNPASPISNRTENRTCGSCLQVRFFFGDGGFAQHREVHGCIRHHAVHASSGCDGNGGLRQNWRLQFRSDVSHGGKTRHRRLDGRSPAPLLPRGHGEEADQLVSACSDEVESPSDVV